jgi:hypothetical protein
MPLNNTVIVNDSSRSDHQHIVNVRRNWRNQLVMEFMRPVVNATDGSLKEFAIASSHILDKIDSDGRQILKVNDADNNDVIIDAELNDDKDLSVDIRSEKETWCTVM